MSSTIKVAGAGSTDQRLGDLEQAINYGEAIMPFTVVGDVDAGGGSAGPPGPAGPGVPAGGTTNQVLTKKTGTDYDTQWSDPPTLAYRHVQSSAATTWTIPHNLSFRPNISAVDSTGREILPGAVDYTSATTVTLTFSAAVGGEAYCS